MRVALLWFAACGRVAFVQHDAAIVVADTATDSELVSPIGCADGGRDGFLDLAMYPRIAGCKATWDGAKDLRAARTGAACGDLIGPCDAPSDACALGWHACTISGQIDDLLVIDGATCAGIDGSYIAASSHCTPPTSACTPNMTVWVCPVDHTDCSQPICCGGACDFANACQDGVWPGITHENVQSGPSCAASLGTTQDGVLCCLD